MQRSETSQEMSFEHVLSEAAAKGVLDIARAPHDGRAQWAHLLEETTAPVARWLDQHAPFQAVSGSVLARGQSAEVVLSSSAAIYLTERAIKFGPNAVAASFRRVMKGEAARHAHVVVVKGISAASAVDVAPGITVEPIVGLIDVPERAAAYTVGLQLCRDGGVPTAIVLRVDVVPTYHPRPVGDGPFWLPPPLPFPPLQIALDTISLGAGVAVVPNVSYHVVEEIGWPTMMAGSIGGSYTTQRVVELTPGQAPVMSNLSSLLNNHACGDSLIRAMQKLKDAQGRNNDAERALDLGACLEILLMHDERIDNTEIGYKLRTRAAWLVGSDPEERQRIYGLVKWAYDARSKVAHTGVLAPARTTIESEERIQNLRDSERLCRTLIEKILRDGWPNWVNIVLQR